MLFISFVMKQLFSLTNRECAVGCTGRENQQNSNLFPMIELCFERDVEAAAAVIQDLFEYNSVFTVSGGDNPDIPLVLLVSPGILESEQVKKRLGQQTACTSAVYPVFIKKVPLPDWLRFHVSSHQWIDASEGDFTDAVNRIVEDLVLNSSSPFAGFSSGKQTCSYTASQPRCFVGRGDELTVMNNWFFRLAAESRSISKTAILSVCGAGGTGKTSLVNRFLGKLEREDSCRWLKVSADSSDTSVDYLMWSRILIELEGSNSTSGLPDIPPGDLPDSLSEESMAQTESFLRSLLSHEKSTADCGEGKLHDRIADFFRVVLKSYCSTRDIVLFLDNFHWVDEGSRKLLGDVLEDLGSMGVSLIVSFRPEGSSFLSGLKDRDVLFSEIAVDTLCSNEAKELYQLLAGQRATLPDQLISKIEETGVSPLYIEMAAGLSDDRRSDGIDQEDLSGLILRHLAHVPGQRLNLLRALSVLGREAAERTVSRVTSGGNFSSTRENFHDDEFAIRKTDSFTDVLEFRHDLIRDTVYSSMPSSVRELLHLRAAVLFENTYRDDPRFSGMISSHWRATGNMRKTLHHTMEYMEYVNSIFLSESVVSWAEKAESILIELGLSSDNIEQMVSVLCYMEEALGRLSRTTERERVLDRLTKVSEEFDRSEGLISAMVSRAVVRKDQGRYDEAVSLLKKAVEMAEEEGIRSKVAIAIANTAAVISDHLDRIDEAESLYVKALEMFRSLGMKRDVGVTQAHLGLLFTDRRKYAKALFYFDKAEETFNEIDRTYETALVFTNRATVFMKLGDDEKALEEMNQAAFLLEKAGDFFSLAITLGNRANLYSRKGVFRSAQDDFLRSIELHIEGGNLRSEEKSRCNYADYLRKTGQFGKALEQLESALELNGKSGNSYWRTRILEGTGRALLESDRLDEAEGSLRSALQICREKEFDTFLNRVRCSLAMKHMLSGNLDSAEKLCIECQSELRSEDADDLQLLESSVILSEVLQLTGRLTEAAAFIEKAEKIADNLGHPLPRIMTLTAQGRLESFSKGKEEGNIFFAEAADIADECGFGNLFWLRGIESYRQQ